MFTAADHDAALRNLIYERVFFDGEATAEDLAALTVPQLAEIYNRAYVHEMMIEADNTAANSGRYREATKWRALANAAAVEIQRRKKEAA